MTAILTKSPLGVVNEPAKWTFVRYRLTDDVRVGTEGKTEKQYIGVLRVDDDDSGVTQMEVSFWTHKPTKILRAACSKNATTEQMIQFFEDYQ